jgi:hypothetical protein
MHTDDRLVGLAHGVKAGIAEFQAQLVFALRSKTAVAFIAVGKSWTLAQLANVNFGMNFQRDHENSS